MKIQSRQDEATGKDPLSVSWTGNGQWSDWTALSEGCYLLRTNLTESDPATRRKQYTQLTEAEWAFRIEKDGLNIRAHLASQSRSSQGAHSGLFPGLRFVEGAGRVDASERLG